MRPDHLRWTRPVTAFRITRRRLPHWQQSGRVYFVTFRTAGLRLAPVSRDVVLQTCIACDGRTIDLHAAVVMPDHVHLLLRPLSAVAGEKSALDSPVHDLGRIAHTVKSVSSHEINRRLGRTGTVWQSERFDRIVRDENEYREKVQYMLNNPVKQGLVTDPYEYPWLVFPEPLRT